MAYVGKFSSPLKDVLPTQVDLYTPRLFSALVAVSLLLFGLVWEEE